MASLILWCVSVILVAVATAAPQLGDYPEPQDPYNYYTSNSDGSNFNNNDNNYNDNNDNNYNDNNDNNYDTNNDTNEGNNFSLLHLFNFTPETVDSSGSVYDEVTTEQDLRVAYPAESYNNYSTVPELDRFQREAFNFTEVTEENNETSAVTEYPSYSVEDSVCPVHYVSEDEVQWTSPNFGQGNYPNDVHCNLTLSSNEPGWASFEFSTQGYDIRGGDFIDFKQPIRMAKLGKKWDGYASSNYLVGGDLPTFNFEADFKSDSDVSGSGFNVTIKRKTSDCHLIVNKDGYDTTGSIESPSESNFGSNFQNKRACEWWIMAPEGKQIQLHLLGMKISSLIFNDPDENGVIIIDRTGDKYYPEETTVDLTGSKIPEPIISEANKMNVIFYSGTSTDYFRARWNVI